MADITDYEQAQIDAANASGRTPVVFIHGLWLLPSSWDRWRTLFEKAGYATLAPGWPDDPNTVDEANRHPEVFAHKTVGGVADHFQGVMGELVKRPALIGHSFGGLLVQILAGRGLADASVAIDPAPFRGVLPLPISALRSAAPVIGNPANHGRAVPLTYEQFRYAFANAVSEDEAKELYNTYAVPAAGRAALPSRDGEPESVDRSEGEVEEPAARAAADHVRGEGPHRPVGDRELVVQEAAPQQGKHHRDRGDAGPRSPLTIDHGWEEVAQTALGFIQRFAKA